MNTAIVIATIIPTLVVTIGGLLYKSKCTHVDLCCGLIKLTRDTEDETQIDMSEIQHPKL